MFNCCIILWSWINAINDSITRDMFKWLVLKYHILLPKGYELECASSVLDLFCFCLLTWLDVSLQITAIVIASPQRLLTIKICYYQVLVAAKSKDESVGKYYPTQQNDQHFGNWIKHQIPAQNYAPCNQCLATGLSTAQRIQFSTQKSELYFSTFMHFNQAISWW